MSPIEKYLELEQKLLDMRIKNGPADSEEEDNLLDEMDEAWWNMSKEEHEEFNKPERSSKFWGELMKNPAWQDFFNDKKQKGE